MQDRDQTVRQETVASLSAEAGRPPHVLVLDDDADTLEMLAFLLRHAGYRVTPVGSASAARDSLEQDPPDIVVLDVTMEGELLGLQVARAARAMERVKVVLHTALPEGVVRAQFDLYDAFLRKPAPMSSMLTVLVETLTRRM
jgi:CheY-like chemotaxis protein